MQQPYGCQLLGLCCRDRQRSVASFHQALQELQGSPLLAQAGVSVAAAQDTADSDLMAVATAAFTAVATAEQRMQQYADGSGWHGRSLQVHACGFVAS